MNIKEDIKEATYYILNEEFDNDLFKRLSPKDYQIILNIFSFSNLESYLCNEKIIGRFEYKFQRHIKEKALNLSINSTKIFNDFINISKSNFINNEYIFLKGIPLIIDVYEDISKRPIRDIDILVNIEQIPDYVEALTNFGYQFKDIENLRDKNLEISQYRYDLLNMINKNGTHIEIHHRVYDSNKVNFKNINDEFLNEFNEINFGDFFIKIPTYENFIIHLVYHASKKSFFDVGIISLLDINKIIQKHHIDYEKLYSKAEKYGLSNLLYIFLAIINKRFGTSIPGLSNFKKNKILDIDQFENLIMFNNVNYKIINLLSDLSFQKFLLVFSKPALKRENPYKSVSLKDQLKKFFRLIYELSPLLFRLGFHKKYRQDIINFLKLLKKIDE